VIIPARDEEQRLPNVLRALASTEPPPHEVIVVDDGSTDATPYLAHQAGALVVPVEPPSGWTGKAWACQRGADAATGDILVFLDADTEPTPEGIAALVALAERGALVSAQPRHRIERPYERLSAGPALVSVVAAGIGPPPRVRWWRTPVAFGPAMAVPAEHYARIGGHAAVKASIAEDLDLARIADRAGIPVVSSLGGDLIGYRMYPEGAASLVEGWSKNLATGAGSIPRARLAATVLWVAAALQAAISLLAALAGGGSMDLPVAAAVYGAFAAEAGVVLHRIGRFGPLTTALYPLALGAFVALFGRSVVLTLARRQVSWRGREIPVGR
jgi:4,4'-diaponeurosporenoate glycosyltransferase